MAASLPADLNPVRGRGSDWVLFRGGFSPNASTESVEGPIVPRVTFPAFMGTSRNRWGGFSAQHNQNGVGVYDVLLDRDWVDILVDAWMEQNCLYAAGTLFLPSQTSGHGLTITTVAAGPTSLSVVYANASGSSTAVSKSNNLITITPQTSGGSGAGGAADNADVAAAINASSVGIVASLGDTDLAPTGGAGPYYFSGGVNGFSLQNATAFVASDTGGDGITYTAKTAGINDIRVIYVFTGTSAPAVAVNEHNITITIATSTGSTKNKDIITAIQTSAAASALITASTNANTDTNTTVTVNVNGIVLNNAAAYIVSPFGPMRPDANTKGTRLLGAPSLALPSFQLQVSGSDGGVDLSAQAQYFVPWQTIGSGIWINSIATTPIAATASVLSTSGASHGLLFTAAQPGDAGNAIAVQYTAPLASCFIASTTAGDGVTWTSQIAGVAGQLTSVAYASPAGATTTVGVQAAPGGTLVIVYPMINETNTGVINAVAANPAAAALVAGAFVGSGTDKVLQTNATALTGGYTQPGTVQVALTRNNLRGAGLPGYTIVVNYASGATNTAVRNALIANPQIVSLVTVTVIGSSGSDLVIPAFQQLSGGVQPTDCSISFIQGATATPSATMTGSACVVSLGTTAADNTMAAVAAAINEAQATGSGGAYMTAVPIGADTGADSPLPFAATNLACNNLIMWEIIARTNPTGAE